MACSMDLGGLVLSCICTMLDRTLVYLHRYSTYEQVTDVLLGRYRQISETQVVLSVRLSDYRFRPQKFTRPRGIMLCKSIQ
jgi:hypothetical protein